MKRAKKFARLFVRVGIMLSHATSKSVVEAIRNGTSKMMLFRILTVLFGFIRKTENAM